MCPCSAVTVLLSFSAPSHARHPLPAPSCLLAPSLTQVNQTLAEDARKEGTDLSDIRFGDNDTPQLQPIQVRPTASPRQLAKQTPRPRSGTSAVGGASALSSDPSLASACSRLLAHVSKLCNHALRPISHACVIPCLPPRLLAPSLTQENQTLEEDAHKEGTELAYMSVGDNDLPQLKPKQVHPAAP